METWIPLEWYDKVLDDIAVANQQTVTSQKPTSFYEAYWPNKIWEANTAYTVGCISCIKAHDRVCSRRGVCTKPRSEHKAFQGSACHHNGRAFRLCCGFCRSDIFCRHSRAAYFTPAAENKQTHSYDTGFVYVRSAFLRTLRSRRENAFFAVRAFDKHSNKHDRCTHSDMADDIKEAQK